MKVHRQPALGPALNLFFNMLRPHIGVCMQAMMNVQGVHLQAQSQRSVRSAMQKRRGVAATTGSHRHMQHVDQRSLVSLKRPYARKRS